MEKVAKIFQAAFEICQVPDIHKFFTGISELPASPNRASVVHFSAMDHLCVFWYTLFPQRFPQDIHRR
jgi:hypothetical protein